MTGNTHIHKKVYIIYRPLLVSESFFLYISFKYLMIISVSFLIHSHNFSIWLGRCLNSNTLLPSVIISLKFTLWVNPSTLGMIWSVHIWSHYGSSYLDTEFLLMLSLSFFISVLIFLSSFPALWSVRKHGEHLSQNSALGNEFPHEQPGCLEKQPLRVGNVHLGIHCIAWYWLQLV